ncbi:hypothetical protein BZG25_09155 [Salinivibrio sp. ML198]|nr:hypothetical protein BZG25_09155 [Salinivibrio sp. ML198]
MKSVAEALDIHPFMLSKWRKAYRDGEFGMVKSQKNKVKPDKAKDELSALKRRIAELEEKNGAWRDQRHKRIEPTWLPPLLKAAPQCGRFSRGEIYVIR